MIGEDEQTIDGSGAKETHALPTATGGQDRGNEKGEVAESAQAAHEFVVFHDREVGKAAKFVKGPAPDEERLVSVRHPQEARSKVGGAFNQTAPGKGVADFEAERAGNDFGASE